jgi:hypothetical protein
MPIIDANKLKYAIERLPKGTQITDLPDIVKAEFSKLEGDDLAKGLLGYYISNKMPEGFDIGPDKVSYSPNEGSEYSMEFSPGDVRLGAKWNF